MLEVLITTLLSLSAFKIALILVLAAFMPVSAFSYLRNRISKKESELTSFVDLVLLDREAAGLAKGFVQEEYRPRAYWVPVAAATLIALLGLITLFFGYELIAGMPPEQPNIVLSGVALAADLGPLRWQSMVVLAFAFVGAYVWSCQNVIRRFMAADLAPVEFFNSALRMVLAPVLSLMLSFLLAALPFSDHSTTLLPVIAFLTGMIPGAALVYLEERIAIFARWQEGSADALPLRLIEGLNRYHQVRLEEAGIDNAQNLAEANIFELALKTPYNPAQMIDWIAQAKLLVYVKTALPALRQLGIRSAFDLRGIAQDDGRIDQLAAQSGIPRLALTSLCASVQADTTLAQLARFHDGLGARFPAGESAEPTVSARTGAAVGAPAPMAEREAA